MGSIAFSQVDKVEMKDIFLKVYNRYKELQHINLFIKLTNVKGSTMQAQPIFTVGSLLGGLNTYKIRIATYVRDSKNLKVEELPADVLTGWFAHELGHIVDYQQYNTWGMLGYGIRYLTSAKFRKQVEHRADEIAMDNGFYEEILATKKFIFFHDLIDDGYKDKMKKYYMSIENAQKWMQKTVPLHELS